MDLELDLLILDAEDELDAAGQRRRNPRGPTVYHRRRDPSQALSEVEFQQHFRLSKETVYRLVNLLLDDISFPNQRGRPLSPIQQVCLTLNTWAGGNFQRISGYCGGVSLCGAWHAIVRVTHAVCRRKPKFIRMPTIAEMEETAAKMFHRFKLPNFALGVDGVQMRLEEAPRGLHPGQIAQDFWCRKQNYSINVQAVGDATGLLRDIVVGFPGSVHDARIWKLSDVKLYWESQRRFNIAGDSGYPISEVLVKPFTAQESGNDRSKRLFNKRLSGIRTVMTENIYGRWKRRFPILKQLRYHLENSLNTIIATAIIHNLCILWNDETEVPSDDDDDDDDGDGEAEQDLVIGLQQPAAILAAGKAHRDRLWQQMPQ